jgi:protein O-GlcNAc transferase
MRKPLKSAQTTQKKLTLEKYKQLAKKLRSQSKFAEAEDYYYQALTLAPLDADIHNLLGNVFTEQNRLTKAISYYQQALSLQPRYAAAFSNLGYASLRQGNQQGAISAYRIALQIEPTVLRYQNLLLSLQFADGISQTDMAQEHFNFNRLFMAHLPRQQWIKPKCFPVRPLRVGYVSGDFRHHSMSFFISQVLKNHDQEQFHVTCYYNNQNQDEFTEKLKSYVQSWVNCATLTDEQLSQKILRDKIDILVDLSGHTPLNRMSVFARSPAPVQITYLGYPNTTGLTTMNYQLVSQTTTPQGMIDDQISEKFLRLSESYCCFDPLMPMPPVSKLPAIHNGYITFASFSRLDKVTETTLKLWCEVLQALPSARFLFYNSSFLDAGTCELWLKRFSKAGIDPQRLTLDSLSSIVEVFQTYENIDVVLDTYPYNGCTTTCQALLMSVPVVSLLGKLTAARVGLDMLQTVGLAELVALKPADYAPIVLSLVKDLTYLQRLRKELRQRMLSSPLMDGPRFTHAIEDLYKTALSI